MAFRIADEIFRALRGYKLKDELEALPTPAERVRAINDLLMNVNITKCTMADLDRDSPGTSSHIVFRIQEEYEIDMGFCAFYKMWYNARGQQERCYFNAGPVQMSCGGDVRGCQRRERYREFENATFYEKRSLFRK
ncbi:MAG TPA: hypothetical protein HA230_05435 [Candidatus Aenigmarchaeota archaeon]|nr:hypothetical protein [Candidatus Aenigmarchaeota archaeon]